MPELASVGRTVRVSLTTGRYASPDGGRVRRHPGRSATRICQ
jgi:hypothetical protein